MKVLVTLTLSGSIYERSHFRIRNAVSISGVDGVTVGTFGIDRVSDTEITVELEFNGNFDTDATLTFTVGADALLRYDGPALIAQLPVTGGQEIGGRINTCSVDRGNPERKHRDTDAHRCYL